MQLRQVFITFLALICAGQALAQQAPVPPTLDAKSWLLLETSSGQILTTEKPDERLEPASLTKLMTAYLTFSALRQKTISIDQSLPVSQKAWKTGGSKMFVRVDTQVPVDDLIKGMIVQSGNDACVTLAEGIAGSEENFAQMMNREAQRLGMKSSSFTNSTGLPDPQLYTTARDLSMLANALIRDFPEDYKKYYSMKEFRYNNITQPNRNRLLFIDPTVDGVKTGHTEAAGYCLISSALRDKRRLLSVVLGTKSDCNARQRIAKTAQLGLYCLRQRAALRQGSGSCCTARLERYTKYLQGRFQQRSNGCRSQRLCRQGQIRVHRQTATDRPDQAGQKLVCSKSPSMANPMANIRCSPLKKCHSAISSSASGTPFDSGSTKTHDPLRRRSRLSQWPLLPLAEAGVSPLDRGFLYGDGVYELIPVYSRQAFRLDEHLTRLQATLDGIKLANPLDHEDWKAVVQKLIAAAPWDDQSIYLQVTRGADNKRDHAFPPASVRRLPFALPRRWSPRRPRSVPPALPPSRLPTSAGRVATSRSFPARQHPGPPAGSRRWLRRSLADPRRLPEGRRRLQHLRRQGWRAARTPKTQLMLPGITYDLVLELAECHGQPLEVREISRLNFAAPTRSG
jgi:D-alanyl-D-alanine carboxypeptidase